MVCERLHFLQNHYTIPKVIVLWFLALVNSMYYISPVQQLAGLDPGPDSSKLAAGWSYPFLRRVPFDTFTAETSGGVPPEAP